MATSALPYELGQLIFEHAARLDRKSIPSLMTEPFLYSIIIRHNRGRTLPPPNYSPPPERLASYAHHVRHLLAVFHVDEDVLRDHLRLCTGLTTVSLWCHSLPSDILDLLSGLSLRTLAVDIQGIFERESPYDFKHIVFQEVTHLELLGEDFTSEELSGLHDLPHLTHLAFNDIDDPNVVESVLESCPDIRVVVLYGNVSGLPFQLLDNDRVASFDYPFDGYIKDWIDFAESRKCIWDLAEEELVEKVKTKELKAAIST
ncbi:hypothetical protein BDN72DRAFT_423333 [Pluteus cervinus]|uniref:Uncharacterized protein n=1 Tax=Pluteus cervinus TaxID=181527 RepID=A0ACD3A7K3_9AGAR|nr:hypothetical protein BDN72DRAFT_423333 [Pluteus cervinus]